MTISEMNEKRAQLMTDAQNAINDSDIETANAKMAEVSALDAQLDSVVTATKNFEALAQVKPAQDITAKAVSVKTVAENSVVFESAAMDKETKYENAWAKVAMGTATAEDQEFVEAYNAAITTVTTGSVIPTTLAKGILDDVSEAYPFYADAAKTFVNGAVTILKDTASSDAAWYDEATPTADGSETIGTITLYGRELARSITVSWKLKSMAIPEFMSYIRAKLSEKMGAALGYGSISGKGVCPSSESNPWKDEPLGVVTALKAESSTPQIVALTSPTDAQVVASFAEALAKLASKYENGACWYINSKTLYGTIAAILDTTNRPIFTVGSEVANGVVGRIFGKAVKIDSAMGDGEILLGNAAKGYAVNINENVTLSSEDHVKARTTDYAAYAIVDGAPVSTKAFALITIS